MATTLKATPGQDDRPQIDRWVGDVAESLAMVGAAAETLQQLDDTDHATDVSAVLATLGRHAAELDGRVTRLAPYAGASLGDVAIDVVDGAETLASRWGSLGASRRQALVADLLGRRTQLAALLGGVDRAAATGEPASVAASPAAAAAKPPRPSMGAKDAAKAWDAWTESPSRERADRFLQLSQSWIEGTGAQLARDKPSSARAVSNAAEVVARIRHHLVLLAGAGPLPYMEALATARRRVFEELHAPPEERRRPLASAP